MWNMRFSASVLVILSCVCYIDCRLTAAYDNQDETPSLEERDDGYSAEEKSDSTINLIHDLVMEEEAAVDFHERPIPPNVLSNIVMAATPYTSLAQWRLIVVTQKSNRIRVLEAMKNGLMELGRSRLARMMERWEDAPALLVFCMPETVEAFGGIPPDLVRPQSLVELGMAIGSISLVARAYGVETHWIAGALLVNARIKDALGIPKAYDVAFFGIAGYPSEKVRQKFPTVHEIYHAESWQDGQKGNTN
ncbi:MAG: nitroreductase family protein [Candidatus Glassbacteria bacterium]